MSYQLVIFFSLIQCHLYTAFHMKVAVSNWNSPPARQSTIGSSSLAFVIDVTGSMYDDLVQVREGYERIFQTVLTNPERVISNYVLVPFHDPDVGPAIVTDDVNYLRSKMAAIDVEGGGDCPEMTLTGIKLALEQSLPSSFLYVFTDARAKDHHLLNQVLSLVQEKQSQVVFVMTGDCGDRTHPGYLAFETIASMSSGQIFHLDKSDVNKIIEYVRLSLMNRRVRIVIEDHDHGGDFHITFPVDSHLFEITVSVAGTRPDVHLTDPTGREMTSSNGARTVVQLSNVIIISVSNPEPGLWTLSGRAGDKHSIRVTGISDLDFSHGFSPYPHVNQAERYYRPTAGIASYLLVNFTGLPAPGVAKDVRLMNARGETISSSPLTSHWSDKSVYYVDSFLAPEGNYLTMVTGEDEMNFKFQRLSPTSICPSTVRRPPLVRMQPVARVLLYQTVTLTCDVQSAVAYTVHWYKNDQQNLAGPLFFERSERIAWTVPAAGRQDAGRYKCSVVSGHGNASAETILEVADPPVRIRAPEVLRFPEHSVAHIDCFPESEQLATITWQRRGEPLQSTEHMRVLFNGTLRIGRIAKSDEGPYVCQVLTPSGRSQAKITVLVIERPTVRVHPKSVQLVPGGSFSMQCQVDGPEIERVQWLHNGQQIAVDGRRVQLSDTYVMVSDVQPSDQGDYQCSATNVAGTASDTGRLVLRDAPRILPERLNVTATENDTVHLECHASGYPTPTVRWTREPNVDLSSDLRFQFEAGNRLTLTKAERADTANYLCTAENDFGKAIGVRRLIVEPPVRYIWTPCDDQGRAVKTVFVPARGDTPLLNRPMLPWDTEVVDFPTVNGTDNVFIKCLPSA